MPEPTPPPDAGRPAGRREGPLTPAAIDAVLADFRRWLEDLAAGGSEPPEVDEPAVDLAALVGAFTALRHEVNLQTRAARAQSEQLADVVAALQQPSESSPPGDEALRPALMALIEMHDALVRATGELEQVSQSVPDALVPREAEPESPAPAAPAEERLPPRSFWRRLFSPPALTREESLFPQVRVEISRSVLTLRRLEKAVADFQAILAGHVRPRLGAAVTGLQMTARRVERTLAQQGLEPIDCVGRPFDPEAMEAMEAVEAVAGSGQPPGTVIKELRRGYRWRGRVFRYAQVRVAR